MTLAIFFAFYVIQPLMMTSMKNAGVPVSVRPGDMDYGRFKYSWTTFLFMLPNYYAQVPVGFLPSKSSLADMSWRDWRSCMLLACADLVNQLMSKVGLMLTSTAAYILINSSGIIWTVALSAIFLGKKPSKQQLFGIAVVFCGLCLKLLDTTSDKTPGDAGQELFGITLVIVSSFLDGLCFVLVEKFQKGPTAIPGPQLTCMQGLTASFVLTAWTLAYTFSGPVWKDYILGGVEKSCELSASEDCIVDHSRHVGYCLYALFAANVFTSSTVWWLLQNVGAVTFVVVKALKIVLVFIMAHFMFCDQENGNTGECASLPRCVCATVVVSGVVIYSLAGKVGNPDSASLELAADSGDKEQDESQVNAIVADAVGLSVTSFTSVRESRSEARRQRSAGSEFSRQSSVGSIREGPPSVECGGRPDGSSATPLRF